MTSAMLISHGAGDSSEKQTTGAARSVMVDSRRRDDIKCEQLGSRRLICKSDPHDSFGWCDDLNHGGGSRSDDRSALGGSLPLAPGCADPVLCTVRPLWRDSEGAGIMPSFQKSVSEGIRRGAVCPGVSSGSRGLHMRNGTTRWLALGTAVLFGACGGDPSGGDRADGVTVDSDWPVITGNLMGQRYSGLTQINPGNFADLEVAWEYDASHLGSVNARSIPIYVDGLLVNVHSQYRTVVATDAGTGEEVWTYTEPETFRWEYSMRKNHGKGVAYANVDGQDVIYLISPAFFLHALDASHGRAHRRLRSARRHRGVPFHGCGRSPG